MNLPTSFRPVTPVTRVGHVLVVLLRHRGRGRPYFGKTKGGVDGTQSSQGPSEVRGGDRFRGKRPHPRDGPSPSRFRRGSHREVGLTGTAPPPQKQWVDVLPVLPEFGRSPDWVPAGDPDIWGHDSRLALSDDFCPPLFTPCFPGLPPLTS